MPGSSITGRKKILLISRDTKYQDINLDKKNIERYFLKLNNYI